MKGAGQVLIAFGFLLAALMAVQTAADEVRWIFYGPALALGVAGVALARLAGRSRALHAPTLELNAQRLQEILHRVAQNLQELHAEAEGGDIDELHRRIDELFREDLDAFAEGRATIAHRFGLESYARVMNEFAAGERYLNRVWSASVDGYVDEAREFLGQAKQQFELAAGRLDELICEKV